MWGQVTFEIEADGTFEMQFGYENCDGNGDTIFDEEEYVRRVQERMKRLME